MGFLPYVAIASARHFAPAASPRMFSSWPALDFGRISGTTPARDSASDRSRSPLGSSPGSAHSAGIPGVASAAHPTNPFPQYSAELSADAPAWSTGVAMCDDWLKRNVLDAQLLHQFGEIPLRNRKSIVMKALTSPKNDPQAWIGGCVHNHRTREMERRLMGMPTPQSAAPPSGNVAGERLQDRRLQDGSVAAESAMPPPVGAPSAAGTGRNRPMLPHSESEDPEMTAWARRVWNEAAGDKSVLIRECMATLSGETISQFQQLPPVLMASVATVWVLARPCAGPAGEVLLQDWMRRHRSLQAIPASFPAAASSKDPGPSAMTLSLQFIVVGCTAGYQHTVIEGMCKLLALQRCVNFKLLPVLCTAADHSTAPMLAAMQKRDGSLQMEPPAEVSALATQVGSKVKGWKESNVKVVFMTTLPMNMAASSKAGDAEAVLHSPSARHMWFSQALANRIADVLGSTNVLELVISPYDMGSADTKELLAKMIGAVVPHATPVSAQRQAEQALVFANCKVSQQTASSTAMRLPSACGPIDGWECPAATVPDLMSGPLAAFRSLPALLTTKLFQERPLTAAEEQLIASTITRHGPTSQTRFASRKFHHRWMGVEGTPFAEGMDAMYACLPWILAVTGDQSHDKSCGESCGTTRYCLQCTRVFQLCSTLPALYIVIPPLTAAMEVALQQWNGQDLNSWIARDHSAGEHHCDAACPRNPCIGR